MKKQRLVSLMTAGILCLGTGITACAEETESVQLPLTEEPVTFTIMVKKEDMSENTFPEKECVQYTEKMTNIHIDWIEVPSSNWTEKLNLVLASGDLPDMIMGGKVDVVNNTDILQPLDELIDEYAPHVQQMFEDIPDLRSALTLSDGHIYSLPNADADVKNMVDGELWINQKWLDKLGLKMPATVDEFYDTLVAFRDGDPNGNGIADEVPLLATNSGTTAGRIENMFGLFGTLDNDDHVRVENDKVIFTPAEDGYYEALKFFHKLYEEGLLNQTYYTEDASQYLAIGNSDPCKVGVALEWYIDNIILGTNVPDFTFIPPLKTGSGDTMLWNASKTPQGNIDNIVITTACEQPELLVKWYDYINSSLDMVNLWNYGPEGLIWHKLDDGRWEVFTDNVPEGSSSSQIRRTMGVGPTGPIYAYSRWRGPQIEKYADRIAAKVEANEAYLPCAPEQRISNGFGDVDEESERNMLLVDINNYLNEFKANAVVNGISDADWQEHLKTLDTLSVDEYTTYWQNYYDAHKS